MNYLIHYIFLVQQNIHAVKHHQTLQCHYNVNTPFLNKNVENFK